MRNSSLFCVVLMLATAVGVYGQPADAQVMLRVTVTDAAHRSVTGLAAKHFEVFEDGVRQEVGGLSDEAAPVSLSIVYQNNGSLPDRLVVLRHARQSMLAQHAQDDEVFLHGYDSVRQSVQEVLLQAAEKLRASRHPRRALVLLADAPTAFAALDAAALSEGLQQAGVQLYGVTSAAPRDAVTLTELTHRTGGRMFFNDSATELETALAHIAVELRHQYTLGYVSTNAARDGRWRKVEVRLNAPRGLPALNLRVNRTGYVANR